MKFIYCLIFMALKLFASESSHQQYKGTALLKSGKIFYIEYHDLDFVNNELSHAKITYKDESGVLLAELDSSYSKSKYLPDTKFLDHRDNYQYKLNMDFETKIASMAHRDSDGDKWKEKKVTVEKDTMLFQGAFLFIQDNWAQLKAGKSKTVHYAIPSRLDVSDVIFEPDLKTKGRLIISIKPQSIFLRAILSDTKLIFDLETSRLLEFNGTSNLLDSKDKSQYVIIKYTY